MSIKIRLKDAIKTMFYLDGHLFWELWVELHILSVKLSMKITRMFLQIFLW